MMASDSTDSFPSPIAFVAKTLNLYCSPVVSVDAVRNVRSEMSSVPLEVTSVKVALAPPPFMNTLYPVMAVPPSYGAAHWIVIDVFVDASFVGADVGVSGTVAAITDPSVES